MTRQIKELTDAQLKNAYYTVYREAFPPAELKPLSSMRRMTRDGVYRSLGLFEGGEPVAFANLWLDGDHILIDYLCVPARRCWGVCGSFTHRRLFSSSRPRLPRETRKRTN